MNPTDILKAEHQNILEMLDILEAISDQITTGTSLPLTDLTDCVQFVVEYADKTHHAKEEDILFNAMVAAGVPNQGGPVGVMLLEHDQGRNYIGKVKQALPDYEQDQNQARKIITANLQNYSALLQA
ncbi:MAG: hemerythrin domain-containing protein, partial [Fidelibacterota bacterium]